jgi:hypothetical protein
MYKHGSHLPKLLLDQPLVRRYVVHQHIPAGMNRL